MFFLIPIAETLYAAIKTKNPSVFAYPIFTAAAYLTGGMLFGDWHPQWIIFLTIPIYYAGCEAYKRSRKSNNGETYYTPDGTSVPSEKSSKANHAVAIIGMIICAITIISVAGITCTFNWLKNFNIDNFVPPIGLNAIDFHYDDGEGYNVGSGDASADEIQKIDVEWVSGSIVIDYYGGDKIRFDEPEQSNSDYALRSRTDGNELQIKYCKSGITDLPSKGLCILLPQGFPLDKLNIESVSSPVTINDIAIKALDIKTVSGKITANGCFEVIDIDNMSAAANIKTAIAPKIIDIDTMNGNAKIIVPPDIAGFKLNFNSMSGNYELNNFDLNSYSKSGGVWGDGSLKIDYDSMSGNLILTKAN